MISPNSYYTVQAWMVNDLGLRDKELLAFAIIYGFSQDGNSEFSGSARYLAEWIGCSRPTIMKVLKSLTEKKLLIKRDVYQNGVCFCTYRAVLDWKESLQGVKEFDIPCKKIEQGDVKNLDIPCKDSLQNNTRDIDRNISIDEKTSSAVVPASDPPNEEEEKSKPAKHRYGEYKNVLLTDEELGKLKELFPADLPDRIERLSEYIASTGKRYKSHYATIRSWANRDRKPATRPQPRGGYTGPVGPNGVHLDPTRTDLDGLF